MFVCRLLVDYATGLRAASIFRSVFVAVQIRGLAVCGKDLVRHSLIDCLLCNCTRRSLGKALYETSLHIELSLQRQ